MIKDQNLTRRITKTAASKFPIKLEARSFSTISILTMQIVFTLQCYKLHHLNEYTPALEMEIHNSSNLH